MNFKREPLPKGDKATMWHQGTRCFYEVTIEGASVADLPSPIPDAARASYQRDKIIDVHKIPTEIILAEQMVSDYFKKHAIDEWQLGGSQIRAARTPTDGEPVAKKPIDMILFCPKCGMLHVDKKRVDKPDFDSMSDDPGFRDEHPDWPAAEAAMLKWQNDNWTNPPHKTHRCQGCAFEWRPSNHPTNGVEVLSDEGWREPLIAGGTLDGKVHAEPLPFEPPIQMVEATDVARDNLSDEDRADMNADRERWVASTVTSPPADPAAVWEDTFGPGYERPLPVWWERFVQGVMELPDRTSPEDEPEMMLASAEELETCAMIAIESMQPNEMTTAPKNGAPLRLLVQPDKDAHTSFEDNSEPYWTIGFNLCDDTTVDEWQFAGWSWNHDQIIEGKGTPIGWLPLL